MKRILSIVVGGSLTLGLACGCCCHRPSPIISSQVPPATMPVCPPTVTPGMPIPVGPPGNPNTPSPPPPGGGIPPPPAFPGNPAASNFGPVQSEDNWRPIDGRQLAPLAQEPPLAQTPDPYPVYPPITRQPEPPRQPPLARIQLAPPEPIQDQQPPVAKTSPPDPAPPIHDRTPPPDPEPPMAQTPQPKQPPVEPPVARDNPPPANGFSFPVGIPQFAMIKDGMATGLRPSLDEGLDWLQKQGYRTVLYVRRPGDPDSADRSQVEKRGMRYMTMEVSPESLTPNQVNEFIATVRDSAQQPIFVYDRDGSLAGGLWYLYFRQAEGATEDVAQVRAAGLGFREDRDDNHRAMWQAAQALLKKS